MTATEIIRIVLADDHTVVRRGIRRMLERDPTILVIGESSTGMGAIDLVHDLQPDILLLDIEMPDMKGYQVAHELRASRVPVSILALSACEEDNFAQSVLQCGINGYLNKSEAPARLLELIHCLSEEQNTAKFRSIPQNRILKPRPLLG